MIIPESVTSIEDYAFSGCTGIKQINLQDGWSTLELGSRNSQDQKGMFFDCSLEEVYIGRPLSYYVSPFSSQQQLKKVTFGGDLPLNIPGTLLRGCTGLASVIIGNSIASINDRAFSGCTGLTSVIIGNSVTSIGSQAFSGCSGLTSVTIPVSVTSIGNNAFSGCTGLVKSAYPNTLSNPFPKGFTVAYDPKGAIIEDGWIFGPEKKEILFAPYNLEGEYAITESVTSIGSSAFYGCSGLTSVTIPNSVTSIGSSAFSGCSSLTSITIPSSGTSIGNSAFYRCSGLTSVTVGNSVTSIGQWAFEDCTSLTSVTIPNSVTSIGECAFRGCTGIKQINIQDGENALALGNGYDKKGLFYDSPLEEIYIGRNLSYDVDGRNSPFSEQTRLKKVTLGDGMTKIPNELLYKCTGLTSVVIGNSVTSIGDNAFRNCTSLTSVTIGNSVTSIGGSAFRGCCGLTWVNIRASVTSIG